MNFSTNPLFAAIIFGDVESVKNLIENRGYSPNYTGWFGLDDTPLVTATKMSQSQIVDYLIQKGADVNALGKWGWGSAPIEVALEHKHTPVVASLLEAKVKIATNEHASNRLTRYEKIDIVTEYLFKAAAQNDVESIEKILQHPYADINHSKNLDPNAYLKIPQTPLQKAISENHFEATSLLIEKGATISVCSPNTGKKHPLNLATDTKIIELLIKHTPELNKCLFGAIMSGKEELITLLVKNGADIEFSLNCGDFGGGIFTPLEFAVMRDDSTMINSLVANGANIAAESNVHELAAPLEFAAEQGKLQALDTLIQLGSDLTHQNANGQTALELASKAGHVDAVNLLTLYGEKEVHCSIKAKGHVLKPIEIHEILTVDDESYPLQDRNNSTISDNGQSAADYENSRLLVSLALNEVLSDEQMIMLADQDIQRIELKIDNNYTMPDTQAESLYIPSMNIPLGSIEHQQLLLG